jgi:quercetin dioxygenase-like cupin family protein
MKLNRHFLTGTVCGALLTGGLSYSLQPARTGGNDAKVLLENDKVRVRQVLFQPGVRPGPHTHPYAHVGVILDEGSLAFVEKGRKDETVNFKSGDAGWRDANVTHEVFNPGKKPVRVVEVELKK